MSQVKSKQIEGVHANQLLDNLITATVDPAVSNDVSQGYKPSSVWVNTTANPKRVFLCSDNSIGAAVWIRVSEDVMIGSNGITAGTKGLVPAPAIADNTNFLRGDGVWVLPPGSSTIPVGTIMQYSALSVPTGYLFTDGSAVSRATYSSLFAAITTSKGTFTVTIASPAVVTNTGHGLATGDAVSLTTTGALPIGLVADTNYYVIFVSVNTFRLATTYANALAGTAINTTGTQSGVHSLLYNPWGISGASDFFLPDSLGAFARGIGTSTKFTANKTIGLGHYDNDIFQGHWHDQYYLDTLVDSGASVSRISMITSNTTKSTINDSVRSPQTDGTNGTPRVGTETAGKSFGTNYIIKY